MMDEKVLTNNGIKIHYRINYGKGQSIVFLHGGGGSLSAWEMILPFFNNKDFTLVTIDLRGHGLSDRPLLTSDYDPVNHAKDIQKIIQKEKLENIVLIGHCLGSMVAATFGGLYPDMLKKLILINTNFELPYFLGRTPMRQISFFLLKILKLLFSYKKYNPGRVDYSKFIGSFDLDITRISADWGVMGIQNVINQFQALLNWQGKEYFRKIKAPTLVIAGRYDFIYPSWGVKRVMNLLENVKLEYIDSNHISVINSPGEVYNKIITFLG